MNEIVEKIATSLGVGTNVVWISVGVLGLLILQSLFKKRSASSIDNYRSSIGTGTTVKFNSISAVSPSSFDTSSSSPHVQSTTSITVNGQEVPINPEVILKISDAIKSGNLIEAIKELRSVSSLSLVDSKQVVEVLKKELKGN